MNSSILLFNRPDSNSVEEETIMYSSTSNDKICLYTLTTCVRIPLDMEFFLLYMVYHSWEIFNINFPTAHYGTNHVDRATKIEGCWKQNKPINYVDKQFIHNHGFFNYVFFST